MAKVSVLGAGSFGVALAVLLSKNGHRVTIRSTSPEKAERLRQERSIPTLEEVILPEEVEVTEWMRSSVAMDCSKGFVTVDSTSSGEAPG